MARPHKWHIYLCYDELRFSTMWDFPAEHFAKYGKVKLFDHYASSKHGSVVVKPRNIYFVPIPLTITQMEHFVVTLSTKSWHKHALCDVDINDYPEIFI